MFNFFNGNSFGAQTPGGSDFNYETEQQRIKRLLAQAAMFQKNTAAPQGQMVGGIYVAPHWSQQLSPVLNNILGGLTNQQADSASADLEKNAREQATKWMESKPAAIPAQTFGSVEEPLDSGIQIGGSTPSRNDMLKWAMTGATNPLTKTLAADYLKDQLIAEPDREAKRRDAAELAREKIAADFNARQETSRAAMERAQLVASNQAATIEERKRANEAAEAYRRDMLVSQDRYRDTMLEFKRQGAAVKPDRMPPSMANAYLGNEDLVSGIDMALADVGTMKDGKFVPAPNADKNFNVGYGVAAAFPGGGDAANLLNKEGVSARAPVFEVTGKKIHERGGTAVSLSESERFKPYLPSNGDSAEAIYRKLTTLKEIAKQRNQEIRQYADDVGYITPDGKYSYGNSTPAPVGAPQPAPIPRPAAAPTGGSESEVVRRMLGTMPDTRSPQAVRAWADSIRREIPTLNAKDRAVAEGLLAEVEREIAGKPASVLPKTTASSPQALPSGVKRVVQW